jgi:hypothetical protein
MRQLVHFIYFLCIPSTNSLQITQSTLNVIFSMIDHTEMKCFPAEFHDVIKKGIGCIAQERFPSPSSDHILKGEQLEQMISALATTEQECDADHSLRHILNRFNSPRCFYAPKPEDYPLEYEIFKRCCSLESV